MRGGDRASAMLSPGPVQWPEGTAHDGKKVSLREMQTRPNSAPTTLC